MATGYLTLGQMFCFYRWLRFPPFTTIISINSRTLSSSARPLVVMHQLSCFHVLEMIRGVTRFFWDVRFDYIWDVAK
jgi:hypothetical protein